MTRRSPAGSQKIKQVDTINNSATPTNIVLCGSYKFLPTSLAEQQIDKRESKSF
jgi:hypothetical protein